MLFGKSLCFVLACATVGQAFSPLAAFLSPRTASDASSTTVLYISSWGTKGPPVRWANSAEAEDPSKNIQAYLKAPEAVEARANIDGTCLVSGLVKSKERTDQTMFDLLNNEESAFEFDKIVAFCDDIKFAKKRLLSRHARYTGLLDKLDFVQATSPGALPTAEQLDGVKSWVAFLENDNGNMLETVKEIAALAKAAPSVENVALLLTGANELEASACKEALETLQGDDKLSYTLVAVGKLEEHAEGKLPYQFREFGSEEGYLSAPAVFSRDESLRMVTELLQLEVGVDKAYAFAEVYNVNQTEAKLIKGLREAGYARPQEIDHMMREGIQGYKDAIEEFRTKNPDAALGYTTDAWWEQEQFQKSRRDSAARDAAKEELVKDERTKEIEKIATEWAKREYFRQSMAGTVDKDMTEEEFTKSVWDRAMFEADLKYRQMKGEATDEETELENFQAQQERKKQTMLKKAKEQLAEILDEDNLGSGDDVTATVTEEEDDDEDDE